MSSPPFIYPTSVRLLPITPRPRRRNRRSGKRRSKNSTSCVPAPRVEMYQAIPYSAGRLPAWPRRAAAMASSTEPEAAGAADQGRPVDAAAAASGEAVRRAVAESPVVVVGRRGCCLSHVVKRLLQGLGVNPAVHEVADEAELALAVQGGEVAALPAVFVGGRLLGGLDRLMAVHISGELVPILKDAGALWL